MRRRILYSYLGMFIPGVILFPVAWTITMGGHSLLFLVVLVCPLGLLGGLVLADLRRTIRTRSIILRTVFAAVISIGLVLILGIGLEGIFGGPGFLLLPCVLPPFVAALSDLIGRGAK